MQLERKNIEKAIKILKNIPYKPVMESSLIGIPIETAKICDFNGLELNVKNRDAGVTRPTTPVLLFNRSESYPVTIGFADILFAKKFDFFDYCDLFGVKNKNLEFFKDIDFVLIDKSNVYLNFEI